MNICEYVCIHIKLTYMLVSYVIIYKRQYAIRRRMIFSDKTFVQLPY